MPPKYELSAEQLAVQEERRRKKAEKQALAAAAIEKNQSASVVSPKDSVLVREWLRKRAPRNASSSITIMSWNLLAQTLVRRDLFPSSDCLKGSQREGMLPTEILTYSPDIACLQEVDRLDKLLPPLHRAGYTHTYAAGKGKKHGCMIIHQSKKLSKTQQHIVYFDECYLSTPTAAGDFTPEDDRKAKGSSRRTNNIALIVALKKDDADLADGAAPGYIVATCHLFWHPRYVYERVRQGAILLRELRSFQESHGLQDWPILLAGDFNSQPSEALYALLVGDQLTSSQEADIDTSRIVHASIDPSIKFAANSISPAALPAAAQNTEPQQGAEEGEGEAEGEGEGEGEGADPDKALVNIRPAKEEDGLLSTAELVSLFRSRSSSTAAHSPLAFESAYDSSFSSVLDAHFARSEVSSAAEEDRAKEMQKTFSSRPRGGSSLAEDAWPRDRKGANEPMYTSFTHYWRLTLDYIFFSAPSAVSTSDEPAPPSTNSEVISLLRTHDAANLEPGLPMKGINASDHIAIVAEIDFHRM